MDEGYSLGDGKIYDGDYVDDKKEGYGDFKWPDGKLYEGMCKDGKQNGQGEIIINGWITRGLWEDGKRLKWVNEKREAAE